MAKQTMAGGYLERVPYRIHHCHKDGACAYPTHHADDMRRRLGAPVFEQKTEKKPKVKEALRIIPMAAKYKPFIYNNVKLLRVVDGDTVELEVNLGYHLKFQDRFRLAEIDAPETNRKATREAGNKSKVALEQMILEEVEYGEGIWIESFKKDSFGRWLCVIYAHKSGDSLNQRMLTEGFAVPYKR